MALAKTKPNFIEFFSGAGGLSEGFITQGFNPLAMIDVDNYCCETLRTRLAYNYLKTNKKVHYYYDYLKQEISKNDCMQRPPQTS